MDGAYYSGGWHQGKFNGFGKYVNSNQVTFEGEFVDGLANGKGTQIHPSGMKYEGYWIHDKPHGEGKLILEDGSKFEGEFRDGTKNGYGI